MIALERHGLRTSSTARPSNNFSHARSGLEHYLAANNKQLLFSTFLAFLYTCFLAEYLRLASVIRSEIHTNQHLALHQVASNERKIFQKYDRIVKNGSAADGWPEKLWWMITAL